MCNVFIRETISEIYLSIYMYVQRRHNFVTWSRGLINIIRSRVLLAKSARERELRRGSRDTLDTFAYTPINYGLQNKPACILNYLHHSLEIQYFSPISAMSVAPLLLFVCLLASPTIASVHELGKNRACLPENVSKASAPVCARVTLRNQNKILATMHNRDVARCLGAVSRESTLTRCCH